MRRFFPPRHVGAACLALVCARPASAGDFWKPFLGGAAAGFVIHEGSHVALDLAFGASPRLKGVRFGKIPFFAVTHDTGLPGREEALISGAGFFSQQVYSEIALSRRNADADVSAFSKGALAFHVATSLGYAGAAFARYGPYERDTRGIASATHSDERLVGVLVLAPALFDTWRYFRPRSRVAKWGARAAKTGFLGFLLLKE